MSKAEFGVDTVFNIGPLAITNTVVTTWVIMALITLFTLLIRSRLRAQPDRLQSMVEGIVGVIEKAVLDVAPEHGKAIMPLIGTLWIFLVIANLSSVIPGIHAPTSNLSATAALAILVFLSVHWFSIRIQGWKKYLHHYLTPSPILLPFHVISEITRTFALAVRLFGNMMSLEMAALLVLIVAGLLAPIPLLMLHIIEALVQAYIFGMLALIYVAGGLQSQQIKQQNA